MSVTLRRWTCSALFVLAVACGRIEPRHSSAVLSLAGRTVAVQGAIGDVDVKDGEIRLGGAGRPIRITDSEVSVGKDTRPLPPGATVTVDVSSERVVVAVGGETLVFTN